MFSSISEKARLNTQISLPKSGFSLLAQIWIHVGELEVATINSGDARHMVAWELCITLPNTEVQLETNYKAAC